MTRSPVRSALVAALLLAAGCTAKATVSPDGRTFASTLRLEMLDMQGKPAEGNGEAVGRAERIGF